MYRDLEDMQELMADMHHITYDRGDDFASGMFIYVCSYFHVYTNSNYYAPSSKSHSFLIKV